MVCFDSASYINPLDTFKFWSIFSPGLYRLSPDHINLYIRIRHIQQSTPISHDTVFPSRYLDRELDLWVHHRNWSSQLVTFYTIFDFDQIPNLELRQLINHATIHSSFHPNTYYIFRISLDNIFFRSSGNWKRRLWAQSRCWRMPQSMLLHLNRHSSLYKSRIAIQVSETRMHMPCSQPVQTSRWRRRDLSWWDWR